MGMESTGASSRMCPYPEFFTMLDQFAGCAAGEPPDWLQELLDGPNAFAAACAAAGWKAAARRLARADAWPAGTPASLK